MLDFDPNALTIPCGHFIAGALVPRPGVMDVRRPSDGEAYAALPVADAAMVDRAVESARAAFAGSTWVLQAPRARARVMRRWADLIETHRLELARLEAVGSTRPIAQAASWDVPYLAETIRFFAEFADKHGGEVAATHPDQLGMMITEPYGVVAAIVPWNFPLVMAGWKIGPALAAGNAVVLKPSEMTPFSAVRLAELAVEAGVPAGILNVVQGDGATTGDALVKHPGVAKITFTGSTAAGRAIMATSAMHGLKPVTLELGGKSPQLVFADADPELASACITKSILGNAGQVCVAGSRLIVHRRLQDELLERPSQKLAEAAPGPTWCATTAYSPIISQRQLERVDGIVRQTVDEGAEAVVGGGRCRASATAPSMPRPYWRGSMAACRPCARRSSGRC